MNNKMNGCATSRPRGARAPGPKRMTGVVEAHAGEPLGTDAVNAWAAEATLAAEHLLQGDREAAQSVLVETWTKFARTIVAKALDEEPEGAADDPAAARVLERHGHVLVGDLVQTSVAVVVPVLMTAIEQALSGVSPRSFIVSLEESGLGKQIEDAIVRGVDHQRFWAACELDLIAAAVTEQFSGAPVPNRPTGGSTSFVSSDRADRIASDPFWARVRRAFRRARDGGYAGEMVVHLVEMGAGWSIPMQSDEVPIAHQAIGGVFAAVIAPARHLPRPRFDAESTATALARALVREVL